MDAHELRKKIARPLGRFNGEVEVTIQPDEEILSARQLIERNKSKDYDGEPFVEDSKQIRNTSITLDDQDFEDFITYAESVEQTDSIGMSRMRELIRDFKITQKKRQLTNEVKRDMIRSGGSITTSLEIDTDEICREVRGK